MYKGLLQSKTVWGVFLMLLGPYLTKWGITNEEAENIASLAVEMGGASLAVYGRIKAKKQIAGIVAPKSGAAFMLIAMLACGSAGLYGCKTDRPQTRISITPEQALALTKISAQTAASLIEIKITNLERKPDADPGCVRALKIAKGIIDEFNAQVADITAINLAKREDIKKAVEKALAGADHLLAGDVLQIEDSDARDEIRAVIAVARAAFQSFDALFPAPVPTQ